MRYLLDENGHGKTFLDVTEMFLDMQTTRHFATSFETYMGISVEHYEENFYSPVAAFLK